MKFSLLLKDVKDDEKSVWEMHYTNVYRGT
jgi:hypothetical protein